MQFYKHHPFELLWPNPFATPNYYSFKHFLTEAKTTLQKYNPSFYNKFFINLQSLEETANTQFILFCLGSKRDASYALSGLVIFLAIFISISRIIILFLSHFESLIKKIVKTIYEMLIYIFSIVFVSNFFTDCGCPTIWQWNIGIFVVFLAWINMLLIASEIPWIGIYVIIFKNIVLTFMKMILFSLILIVGFTFVLFMIFFDPNAQVSL